MAKMDERTLAAIVKNRVSDSVGLSGDQLSQDRITALKYYRGDTFGNERDGRSQVVLRMVAEAVDGMLPGLLKVFMAGDEIVRFEPKGPEDEQACKQATDYVNWIVTQQNDGFRLFNVWFKDALLQKTGVLKVWWDDAPRVTREQYRGLSEEQYLMLKADSSIEIEEEETVAPEVPGIPPELVEVAGAMVPGLVPPVYNVTVRKTNKQGRVCIEAVPPEEFLIEPWAVSLEDALFCAHRFRRTVSWWKEQGYDADKIQDAIGADMLDLSGERSERHREQDQHADDGMDDESTRYVWGAECYIKVDYDGDGVAELRKVTVCGESQYEILDNEEIDEYPFATITPIIMPHKFHGMSVADQAMDLQLWGSTLVRQMNDNLYLTNDPQRVVKDGQVNLDDLLSGGPGRVIRTSGDVNAAIREVTVPFWAKETFPMLEYIDGLAERRTGNTRYNQGLDADSLNKTATGINIIQNAAQQRQELIARVFAETGVKRLFKLVLGYVTKYQKQKQVIRLRNQWVTMDPREWKNGYDMVVNVGLGTGNKQEQLVTMSNMLQMTMQIVELQGGIDGPIVMPPNVFAQLSKYIEAAGLKKAETYFTDPATQPPKEPKPDPEQQKAQQEMQLAQAQAQLDAQTKQQDSQLQAQMDSEKCQQEIQMMWMKAMAQIEIDKMKAAAQIEVEKMKASVQAQVLADKAQADNDRANFQTAEGERRADESAKAEAEREKETAG